MLAATMLLTMFQYDHDTNNRLLDLAAQVTPEQWDAPNDAGQRSLHETLFHLLVVEKEYLCLCRDRTAVWGNDDYTAYPDAASLRALNDHIYTTYLPYLESLSEDQLASTVTAFMPSDRVETVLIWHLLIHMLYHSAQHRSECAFMLTKYDHSPGFIDFYGFGSWGAG